MNQVNVLAPRVLPDLRGYLLSRTMPVPGTTEIFSSPYCLFPGSPLALFLLIILITVPQPPTFKDHPDHYNKRHNKQKDEALNGQPCDHIIVL